LESNWRWNLADQGLVGQLNFGGNPTSVLKFAARLNTPVVLPIGVATWLLGRRFGNLTEMVFGVTSMPSGQITNYGGFGGVGHFPGTWAVELDN